MLFTVFHIVFNTCNKKSNFKVIVVACLYKLKLKKSICPCEQHPLITWITR